MRSKMIGLLGGLAAGAALIAAPLPTLRAQTAAPPPVRLEIRRDSEPTVVLNEKHPTRWVRQVRTLTIRRAEP